MFLQFYLIKKIMFWKRAYGIERTKAVALLLSDIASQKVISCGTFMDMSFIITIFCKCAQCLISYEPQREKTYLVTCEPNEDSNQPAHPRCLIRVFVVRMKKLCILAYPKCGQWRFWSDCANAQADLNLRWPHMSEGTFMRLRFVCY